MIGLSDIISVIAIVVSIVALAVQFIVESKRGYKNRIRELYNQAYKDILMKDIPLAVMSIRLTKNGVNGTDDFTMVCTKLRHNSGFFRFYDLKFFDKVVSDIMEIEDYVLEFDNNSYSKIEFDAKIVELEIMIKKLYDLIMNKCL